MTYEGEQRIDLLLASIQLRREEITGKWCEGGVKEIEAWILWDFREFFTNWRFWAESEGRNEKLDYACYFSYDKAANGELYRGYCK